MIDLLRNTRRPDIVFFRNGRIDISARAVRLLGISEGDIINIVKDGAEFYLCVKHAAADTVGRHQGRCFPTSRSRRGLPVGTFRAHWRNLTDIVFDICSFRGDPIRLPCGEPATIDNKLYLPIIIRQSL